MKPLGKIPNISGAYPAKSLWAQWGVEAVASPLQLVLDLELRVSGLGLEEFRGASF